MELIRCTETLWRTPDGRIIRNGNPATDTVVVRDGEMIRRERAVVLGLIDNQTITEVATPSQPDPSLPPAELETSTTDTDEDNNGE